jgi:hypothetical protein
VVEVVVHTNRIIMAAVPKSRDKEAGDAGAVAAPQPVPGVIDAAPVVPAAAVAAAAVDKPEKADGDDVSGKWAVVLASSYGTAQQYKVTDPGAPFPDCK